VQGVVDRPGAAGGSSSAGEFPYDRMLLAMGAEPVRLDTKGFDRGNVFALRTQATRMRSPRRRKGRARRC
jgi:NADPH-dependent 2,4-dienoyl-CoA reductase/sulfur reductase-like enzyme